MSKLEVIKSKPLRQCQSVQELLLNDQAKGQLAAVAASHMKPERMMRLMANAIRTNPDLGKADPITLLGAMMTSAGLGLEPNTVLGHAYLIPRKNRKAGTVDVNFQLGYKGMVQLALRSDLVQSIHGDVVYSSDTFEFEYGSNQHLRHIPAGSRKEPIYAYAHAKLADGEAFVVLPWEVVLETRDKSDAYRYAVSSATQYGRDPETADTPWVKHLHAMAKKTAIRRLFDDLPISTDMLSDAMTIDDSSADFGAFAMDPSAGMPDMAPPAEDGELIEGEAAEPERDPEPEEKPKPKPRTRKKAEPKPKEDPKPDQDQDQGEAPSDEDNERLMDLFDRIKGDLSQGPSMMDATLELWGNEVEVLKEQAPELHADLMKLVEDLKG